MFDKGTRVSRGSLISFVLLGCLWFLAAEEDDGTSFHRRAKMVRLSSLSLPVEFTTV